MTALQALVLLALLAVIAFVLTKVFGSKDTTPPADTRHGGGACATCSEQHGKCLQECVMENAAAEIVYFDDEELDRFKQRPSNSYTDDEASEFAEVMYTMKPEEVKDWLNSLTLRGVSLPDQLKDEAIMLIEE